MRYPYVAPLCLNNLHDNYPETGGSEIYPIQWREPKVNLAELAKLRWIDGWSRRELAVHYGKSINAIQNYFHEAKRLRLKPKGVLLANRD